MLLVETLDFMSLNNGVGPLVILGLAERLTLNFELVLVQFDALELLVVHSVNWLLYRNHTCEIATALGLSDTFCLNFVAYEPDTFWLLGGLSVKLVLTWVILESIRLHWQSRVDLFTWFASLAHIRVECSLRRTGLERLSCHLGAVIMDNLGLIRLLIKVVVIILSHYQRFLELLWVLQRNL